MTAETAGAVTIDPMQFLCENGLCIVNNQNGPIRIDGYHLRPSYVRYNVTYLDDLVAR